MKLRVDAPICGGVTGDLASDSVGSTQTLCIQLECRDVQHQLSLSPAERDDPDLTETVIM